MADYSISVEATNCIGHRAYVATSPGIALVPAYKGTIGGSLYIEIRRRADGEITGNSATDFPAGFAWGKLDGSDLPDPSGVDVDSEITLWAVDPTPGGPWAFFAAIQAEIQP